MQRNDNEREHVIYASVCPECGTTIKRLDRVPTGCKCGYLFSGENTKAEATRLVKRDKVCPYRSLAVGRVGAGCGCSIVFQCAKWSVFCTPTTPNAYPLTMRRNGWLDVITSENNRACSICRAHGEDTP